MILDNSKVRIIDVPSDKNIERKKKTNKMKDNNLAYKYSQGSRRKRNHFTIVRHFEV